MGWQKPAPRVVWLAIRTYLEIAYHRPGPRAAAAAEDADDEHADDPGGVPATTPSAVRARLETLRSTPDDAFYDSPVFERAQAPAPLSGPKTPANDPPVRFALRLGNTIYPHMKLVIDRSPDGAAYLLRADTHDAHCAPRPGSRESAAFAELARQNGRISEAIESAWEEQGLPTFKKFLRDDLERRRAAQG